MKYVKQLSELTRRDAKIAGGKASALGELIASGFLVPDGFAILTKSFDGNRLRLEAQKEILQLLKATKISRFAVRSSGSGEDSRQSSWAGQLETFLNVSVRQLLGKIEACRISNKSLRAKYYQKHKKLNKIAVIVQAMVQADLSGVAFTADPVTGNRRSIYLEVVSGLGDMLVSGQKTPDSYCVDKKTGKINGNSGSLIHGRKIIQLVKTFKKIEKKFGYPCDIEWSIKKGKVYILQCRPISTTGSDKKEKTDTSLEFWARESFSPLFWITDPGHKMPDCVVFCRKNQSHFYYIGGSEEKMGAKGKRYFRRRDNPETYLTEGKKRIKDVENFADELKKINFPKLTDEELSNHFKVSLKKLEKFIDHYTLSEASSLEFVDNLTETQLDKLARLRLEMRPAAEELYFLTIGLSLKELARRHHVPLKNELFWYSLPEILTLAKRGVKISHTVISNRKKNLCVYKRGAQFRICSAQECRKLWAVANPKVGKELRGRSAYPGHVIGRARVIFQQAKQKKNSYAVRKGEILVTDMTKPDMVLVLKKVAAIVTDEGGIVSHAAILAREYKVPCLMGTKHATQIIKTGDKIEVDATRGVVRKIAK